MDSFIPLSSGNSSLTSDCFTRRKPESKKSYVSFITPILCGAIGGIGCHYKFKGERRFTAAGAFIGLVAGFVFTRLFSSKKTLPANSAKNGSDIPKNKGYDKEGSSSYSKQPPELPNTWTPELAEFFRGNKSPIFDIDARTLEVDHDPNIKMSHQYCSEEGWVDMELDMQNAVLRVIGHLRCEIGKQRNYEDELRSHMLVLSTESKCSSIYEFDKLGGGDNWLEKILRALWQKGHIYTYSRYAGGYMVIA